MKQGRKPIYDGDSLKIGEKMQLSNRAKPFKYQYLYSVRNRSNGEFELVEEDNKVFIERKA
jgi:hypothetical protein